MTDETAFTAYEDPHKALAQQSPFDVQVLLAGQLTQSSIDMYRRDVAAYQAWAQSHDLDTLNALTLAAWRDDLALSTTMSPNTINRMLAAVKRVVKQAASKGMVDAHVAMQFETLRGVKVKALKSRLKDHARTRIEPDDMRRLCETPDASTLIGKRDAALLATLASSGLRASELASLTSGQMRKQGKGYVLQVKGKTDIEYRDAHLSHEAHSLIMAWIDARLAAGIVSAYIFTAFAGRGGRATAEPMSETSVWLIVRKYAQQEKLAHVKPHDFRRFVGTQLARRDIRKAQLALGHKSIEVTARHYVLDRLEAGETDNLY